MKLKQHLFYLLGLVNRDPSNPEEAESLAEEMTEYLKAPQVDKLEPEPEVHYPKAKQD